MHGWDWVPWAAGAAIVGGLLMPIMDGRTYRGTTFGGEGDIWDVAYNSAYFWAPKKGESPAEYYARIPLRMRHFFVPEMARDTTWKMVRAYLYPAGFPERKVEKIVRSGTSGYLDAEYKDYCAYNVTSPVTRAASRAGRGFLLVTANGKQLLLPIIDHGPSGDHYKIIDMSPHAYRYLDLDKKNKISSVERIIR